MLSWRSKPDWSKGSLLLGLPVFASAWLLFAIEPMMGKLLLPVLGGSPATWAACMVAFQLLLLAGYLYAHLGARWLETRRQATVHALLVLVSVAVCWQTRLGAPPDLGGRLPLPLAVPWFVLLRVGAPFVVLASTAPMLARWAAPLGRSGHALYAVSNVGALLGLLAYPFVLEPFVGLPVQLSLWAAGFVLFGLGVLPVCVVVSGRAERAAERVSGRVPIEQRLFWLACAFLPSALLLAITNYISVDVAATPLSWVVPLVLYLISFIVAFSELNRWLRGPALVMWVVGAAWLSLNAFAPGAVSLPRQLAPALLALLGASLLCHGELSRARPREAEPTGYFLLIAAGGALGGAFVSLLSPVIFTDFYELEVAAGGVFGLLLWAVRRPLVSDRFSRASRVGVYVGAGLCLPLLASELALRSAGGTNGGRVVERRRSFLGPLRVVDLAEGRVLTHGRIQHGMQLFGSARNTATMYFGAGTGVERVLEGVVLERPRRLGVVGLGVGTLASFGRRGDTLRFYELDPNVVEVAQRQFTFLRDSAAQISVVVGDGRLALAREASQAFDVLVLDAFSSDAVPVHLLTRQAFEIYVQHLAPGGVLLANVSNRHLAVERVVRGSADAVGLSCQVVETQSNALGHVVHVVWAVMAKEPALLDRLLGDLPRKPAPDPDVSWTDSRASVLSILR